jgi:hypothetical protein
MNTLEDFSYAHLRSARAFSSGYKSNRLASKKADGGLIAQREGDVSGVMKLLEQEKILSYSTVVDSRISCEDNSDVSESDAKSEKACALIISELILQPLRNNTCNA